MYHIYVVSFYAAFIASYNLVNVKNTSCSVRNNVNGIRLLDYVLRNSELNLNSSHKYLGQKVLLSLF